MSKPNNAIGETTDMAAGNSASQGQAFGYVQPTRLYKLGKRTLVYRLPGDGKHFAVSKPLAFFLVLILAALASGYVNVWHLPDQSMTHILPASVVPANSIHRLITISAAQGTIILPFTMVPGGEA